MDRNDYIDKVERNLNDGSFDILRSDPLLSYYHIVKDWGDKWVEKGEITQPLVDCILNVNARPGKNYGLIKTHKPNNPIRLITSGNGTAVENLSLFTEHFLHPCVKKEPQSLKLITNFPHFRQVLYWCHGMLFLCTPVMIIKWV